MKIEIRNNSIMLDGYVNAVARDSRELPSPRGRFVEQILPKTFQKALDKADNVYLLFNHKENRKLGSTKEGNLELYEDNIGLRAKCIVTDEEIIKKAKNNKLKGWSFGFIANKDRWEDYKDGVQRRYIEDMDLLEVSILDKTPAYVGTSIEQRGEKTVITEFRNEEFIAKIEDNSNVEKREVIDYKIYEQEIELLKLKY